MTSNVLVVIFLATLAYGVIGKKFLHSNVALRPAASSAPANDSYVPYDGKYVVKLSACSEDAVNAAMASLMATDCIFLNELGEIQLPKNGCGEEYVICSALDADRLAAHTNASDVGTHGAASFSHMIGSHVVNKDAGSFFRSRAGETKGWDHQVQWDSDGRPELDAFYNEYRPYVSIESRIQDLVAGSGGVAVLHELSPKTHEGRSIKAVRIRGAKWTNGMPRVVLTFQMHAREWVTGMTGMYTLEQLIKICKQEPSAFEEMEIVVVPIVNPDGFVYSSTKKRFWRKNRRPAPPHGGGCEGVDLNRNWATMEGEQWEERHVCKEVDSGVSSKSEPESQALENLIQEAPTMMLVDVHSYGQIIIAPKVYERLPTSKKEQIDKLGLDMQNAISSTHGVPYTFFREAVGIYEAVGTFQDWAANNHGVLGFTFELRPHDDASDDMGWNVFAPGKNDILPTAEEAFQGISTGLAWARENHRSPTSDREFG
jgi:hypothetical protein